MNEITGIKQNFDLLIFCLIIKKLQKLGTKIDTGDKDCFDPTVHNKATTPDALTESKYDGEEGKPVYWLFVQKRTYNIENLLWRSLF